MEYYKKAERVDPVHVPYKGGAPALQEVMGGQMQLMMALVPEAMPLVKSGRLRALAVTTTKRLRRLSRLPTVAESGGKDFDMTFWYAFMAPAGTPADIVTTLNQAIDTILARKGGSREARRDESRRGGWCAVEGDRAHPQRLRQVEEGDRRRQHQDRVSGRWLPSDGPEQRPWREPGRLAHGRRCCDARHRQQRQCGLRLPCR